MASSRAGIASIDTNITRYRDFGGELFQASRSIGKRLKQTDLAFSKKFFCRHKSGRNLQDRFACDRLHDVLSTVLVCVNERGEVGIERLADLHDLLAGETAAGGKLGDRFEIMVLPTRQAPGQHASRDAADVLEAVHDIARDEKDAAGTRRNAAIAW